MLPEAVTLLFGVFVALIVGAALIYITGFAVSMLVALFYVPIEAVSHAHVHMPDLHMPHMHIPHHA